MAVNQTFDWEQHPLYVQASRTQILPGGSTRYHPSRDVGVTLTDRTSFIAGQADWSPDNLPEVQYYLFPPRDRDVFRRKPIEDILDANGQIVYEQWPTQGQAARPLKNFPVLPRQVGSQDYPWIIDAWRKLDPRIQGEDVLMRIDPAGRPHKWNTFQQRLGRLRADFNVISWHATRSDPLANIPTANVLAKLKPWHHEMNTTRGLTPGLLIPELGEDGGRVPLPDYEDSRGFGREFSRRQGPSAGPAAAQPTTATRKRTRKAKPQTQTAAASSSSQDNDSAEESSSDDEEEQPPQRKPRRAPRASQNPTLPSSHPGVSVSRDSAGRGGQNVQQNHPTSTQQSVHPLFQHPVQQFVHPLFQQAYSANTQQSVHPLLQQPVQQAQSADTQQSSHQLAQPPVQQSMGNTPDLPQQTASYVNAPGSRLAPYPPGFVGAPGPLRQMTTTQLLGRSSTDATNVIRFSGIGHSDRRQPYHPFTRMDIRNTQHVRPPLAPHLSAGTQAAPSTDNTQGEPRFRHFRVPGPSPTLTPSQREREEDVARRGNDMQGYVDPFLLRFYKQYLPPVSSGYLNPVLQTRLTFVQRLQILTDHELLSAEAPAEALQIETITQALRASYPISQRRERQAGRERGLSNDMPPALEIRRRMTKAQARLREADTFSCSQST